MGARRVGFEKIMGRLYFDLRKLSIDLHVKSAVAAKQIANLLASQMQQLKKTQTCKVACQN